MFGAYVRENRKVVIALAVYTAVFAFIFWLYRLPLGAVGYAALVCLFLLLVWFAVDYRRFAVRLRLLRRLEQEITLSTEQLPEPDGALEAQYQALVRALDADRRAQLTRSQQGYQELVEYYTVWAHQIKTPIAAMRLLLQDADTDVQRALLEQLQSVEQYVEMVLGYLRLESPSSDYVIRNYALDDIVRQAVRKYASQFIRRKLRLEYTPLNVSVITDEKWLLFVIEQVLSNALKYTRSGSVSITSSASAASATRASASRARGSAACLKGLHRQWPHVQACDRHRPVPLPAHPCKARPHDRHYLGGGRGHDGAHRSAAGRARDRWPCRIVSFRRENVSQMHGSHFPGGLSEPVITRR